LVKPSNPETKANGGVRLIIGDGTNRRAYYVGGNDDLGLPVKGGWGVFRLDTANFPASYSQDAGSAAPTLTAITQVGVGILQPSKAVGNSPNTWLDRIAYITNGSPAFLINGGVSAAPEAFADLVSDDETNGWGFFNNPIAGSKQYGIYGAAEWGDSAAASYFEDSNAQIFFIGSGLSAGTMDQDVLGYSGGTNSLIFQNCILVAIGAAPNWNFNIADHNILSIESSQFIGQGTFAFPASDVNKQVLDSIFDSCGLITTSTLKFEESTVRNASGNGISISSISHNVKNSYFTDNNYAIQMPTTGDFTFDGLEFIGNTIDINNTSGGTININSVNAENPPTTYTGDTNIVASAIHKLTGMVQYSEVTYVETGTENVLFHIEDVDETGITEYSYNAAIEKTADIHIHHVGYVPVLIPAIELTAAGGSIPITQRIDRFYSNP